MFVVWQRTVGGRLKSDLRLSNTVVWSNFPVPSLSVTEREQIVGAGRTVEVARATADGRTLADLYHPTRMPMALRQAHDELDNAVDLAFGMYAGSSEVERQAVLFTRYADATSGLFADARPRGRGGSHR